MNRILLNPSAVARLLGSLALLLVLASMGGQFSKHVLGHQSLKGLVPLFDLDVEQNIPTYFQALLILFAALLLIVITVFNAKQRTPQWSQWAILTLGFLLMAYDEIYQVHEKLILPFRALLGGGDLGIFYFAWVVPGIALILVLAFVLRKFLLHFPAATRLRFMMAAALYLGGAIGVELIGGLYAEKHGVLTLTYGMIAAVEESLEMAGLVVLIWALLKYRAEHYEEGRRYLASRQCAASERYSAALHSRN